MKHLLKNLSPLEVDFLRKITANGKLMPFYSKDGASVWCKYEEFHEYVDSPAYSSLADKNIVWSVQDGYDSYIIYTKAPYTYEVLLKILNQG